MIIKIETLSEIETDSAYMHTPYYIDTKHIYFIARQTNINDLWGININGTFLPLYDCNEYSCFQVYDSKKAHKISNKYFSLDDENEKKKLQTAAWEHASKKMDTIYNQIIKAMRKED